MSDTHPTLVLPQRLTIDSVEELHARVLALTPGTLDGAGVTVIDGAGAQWLAAAVATGWQLGARSTPLEKGVSLLGLTQLLSARVN